MISVLVEGEVIATASATRLTVIEAESAGVTLANRAKTVLLPVVNGEAVRSTVAEKVEPLQVAPEPTTVFEPEVPRRILTAAPGTLQVPATV